MFEKVGVDFMCFIGETGVWLGVNGLNTHFLHEATHPLHSNAVSSSFQSCPYSTLTVEGAVGIDLIDLIHQEDILGVDIGFIVDS